MERGDQWFGDDFKRKSPARAHHRFKEEIVSDEERFSQVTTLLFSQIPHQSPKPKEEIRREKFWFHQKRKPKSTPEKTEVLFANFSTSMVSISVQYLVF